MTTDNFLQKRLFKDISTGVTLKIEWLLQFQLESDNPGDLKNLHIHPNSIQKL